MDNADIDQLATAYRQGNLAALPSLVQGLARMLLAQAYRLVRDWDLAADMVQDTWLRVSDAIERWDPDRPFLPWLRAILRNRCLQYLAGSARQPVVLPLGAAGEAATERADDRPDHAVDLADLRGRLARHLECLPESQRQAVIMIDLEQRGHAETAATLDLTQASLRVILHRARRALGERLRREEQS